MEIGATTRAPRSLRSSSVAPRLFIALRNSSQLLAELLGIAMILALLIGLL